jgi:hypothetical protein
MSEIISRRGARGLSSPAWMAAHRMNYVYLYGTFSTRNGFEPLSLTAELIVENVILLASVSYRWFEMSVFLTDQAGKAAFRGFFRKSP